MAEPNLSTIPTLLSSVSAPSLPFSALESPISLDLPKKALVLVSYPASKLAFDFYKTYSLSCVLGLGSVLALLPFFVGFIMYLSLVRRSSSGDGLRRVDVRGGK